MIRQHAAKGRMVLAVACLLAVTAGCGGGSGSDAGAAEATTTATDVATNPAASSGTSAASGRCSKASARQVVERFGLSISEPSADPVGKVLCGAFAGPGSQTMVVSLVGPGNAGLAEWAVFRLAGGAWAFLMKQPAAASITVAGSDIRQTLPIYLPADSRCCPSGGRKTRIWHWNGTRFTASPWKRLTPGTAPPSGWKSGYFKTPSGNIVCFYSPGPKDLPRAFLGCGIKSGLKPAPPHRACQEGGYAGDRVELLLTGRVTVPSCAGDPGALVGQSIARVLGYGKTWTGGGFTCTSAVTGLTCRSKSGHGFFLSREHWRAF